VSILSKEKEEFQRKIAKDARTLRALKAESEQMRLDLTTVMTRLTSVETEVVELRAKMEREGKKRG
jgi:predicted  nucleic acid-binding Zn-ribbon protein